MYDGGRECTSERQRTFKECCNFRIQQEKISDLSQRNFGGILSETIICPIVQIVPLQQCTQHGKLAGGNRNYGVIRKLWLECYSWTNNSTGIPQVRATNFLEGIGKAGGAEDLPFMLSRWIPKSCLWVTAMIRLELVG